MCHSSTLFEAYHYLRYKTYVPVFYRGNKLWVRVRVRINLITSAHAPERVPTLYYRDKTWVQMFNFDSNTTVPIQCAAYHLSLLIVVYYVMLLYKLFI